MPFERVENRAQNRNFVYIFKQYFKINTKEERPRHACENYLQDGHRTYNVNTRRFRLNIVANTTKFSVFLSNMCQVNNIKLFEILQCMPNNVFPVLFMSYNVLRALCVVELVPAQIS